jgi:hypothetical protein
MLLPKSPYTQQPADCLAYCVLLRQFVFDCWAQAGFFGSINWAKWPRACTKHAEHKFTSYEDFAEALNGVI